MTDRVYPSAKPATVNGVSSTTPAGKPPLYNPNRHPYRPNPTSHRRRSRRSCFCLCCFWLILSLILLLLLAAIAGCVAYVIYSPRRPMFSVTSVRISRFNLTTSAGDGDGTTHLSSAVNLTLSAKNPNKKITYSYDTVFFSLYSNQALIANGSLPSFVNYPNDPKILRSTLLATSVLVDADLVSGLRSDLKRKSGFPMEIKMDTKVVVRMGKMKTKKVGIRVVCDGIKGVLPKGKSVLSSNTANAKCKVDLRIKIWKFTV